MNILLAESSGFSPRALELLHTLGAVRQEELSGAALLNAVDDCDVLWVRLRNYVGSEVMDAAPRLKWIVSPTTGLNHIDLAAAEKRGICILSLQGQVDFLKEIRATAELTVGLMLALLRRIPSAAKDVREGGWNRDYFQGRELRGQDVGLVGLGRLGHLVAGYLLAFGSRVRAYDPRPEVFDLPGVEQMSLEELLTSSRLVSLHASYKSQSKEFFDAICFERMPQGSWFVNTARGELVDEAALLATLKSGHLAGAAIDVLSAESSLNLSEHPLVNYARTDDRLIITPHIGGCTLESMEQTEWFMAQQLNQHRTMDDSQLNDLKDEMEMQGVKNLNEEENSSMKTPDVHPKPENVKSIGFSNEKGIHQ